MKETDQQPTEPMLQQNKNNQRIPLLKRIKGWVQKVYSLALFPVETTVHIPWSSSPEQWQRILDCIIRMRSEGHKLRLTTASLNMLFALLENDNCPNCPQVPKEWLVQREFASKILCEILRC